MGNPGNVFKKSNLKSNIDELSDRMCVELDQAAEMTMLENEVAVMDCEKMRYVFQCMLSFH